MAVVEFDSASTQELREHRHSFMTFERIVLFAVMHVALMLVCLALAFIGHIPLIAVLLGAGGTLALIIAFVLSAANDRT
jgi:hypothetical protein